MKRVLAIGLLLIGAIAFVSLSTGASDEDKGLGSFKVELDNAFANLDGILRPIPTELRPKVGDIFTRSNQRNRCPGAAEHPADDKSNPWKPTEDHNCDPSQTLPGK